MVCNSHEAYLRSVVKNRNQSSSKNVIDQDGDLKAGDSEVDNLKIDNLEIDNLETDCIIVDETKKLNKRVEAVSQIEEPPKKKGRPREYQEDERVKLAILASNGVSLDKAGFAFKLFQSDLKNCESIEGASRDTVARSLVEVMLSIETEIAYRLSFSKSIYIACDCSGDKYQRNCFALKIGGLDTKNQNNKWSFPIRLVELFGNGHTARAQCEVIQKCFYDLNVIQKKLDCHETKLYEIQLLVCDNTFSNIGENGVRGVLNQLRKLEWQKESIEVQEKFPFADLITKGCDDHISNIVSHEFEKRICQLTTNWSMNHFLSVGKKHAATYSVIHVMKRLLGNPFRRPFRAFLKFHDVKSFHFVRVSETRFSSIDIISLTVYQYYGPIVMFLYLCRVKLTEQDLMVTQALLDPEILSIIKIRAVMASKVLLPFMETSNLLTNSECYQNYIKELQSQLQIHTKNVFDLFFF